jgi:hypothetical protein
VGLSERLAPELSAIRAAIRAHPAPRLPAGEGTKGGRIYDARIAEIARLAGARLVATENRRHFTSLLRHGIRVLVSAELAQEIVS